MTTEEQQAWLRSRLPYWQKRLRLQDWEVEVEIVRNHKLDAPTTYGELSAWLPQKRYAQIRVLDTNDRSDTHKPIRGECPEQQLEITLVHELLHIYTEPLVVNKSSESPVGVANEQAIDAISVALVMLEAELRSAEGREAKLRYPPEPTGHHHLMANGEIGSAHGLSCVMEPA